MIVTQEAVAHAFDKAAGEGGIGQQDRFNFREGNEPG
jgi:hypothetical protein